MKQIETKEKAKYKKSNPQTILSKYVDQAKLFIGKIKDYQYRTAKIILEAQEEIENSGWKFSLRDFADQVGVPKSTLHDWIKAYKLISVLPAEYKDISMSNSSMLIKSIKVKNISKDEVLNSLAAKLNTNRKTLTMNRYLKILYSIDSAVKDKTTIKEADQEVLIEILSVARSIVYELAKLDKKEKYANVD